MPLSPEERELLRPIKGKIAFAVWTGDLLEITYVSANKELRLPGKRAQVGVFTPSARFRMLKMVAQVDWSNLGDALFISLTYPDSRSRKTSRERNMDRHRFFRSMENYLGRQVGTLWRVEWKRRLSGKRKGKWECHFHLIVFDVRFIAWQRIRKWWRDVLKVEGPLCTDVDSIKGKKQIGVYISKYCAKPQEFLSLDDASYLNTKGRHWGTHRKHLIPMHSRKILPELNLVELQKIERVAAHKFTYFTPQVDQPFTLIGDDARKVGLRLCMLRLDNGEPIWQNSKVERGD